MNDGVAVLVEVKRCFDKPIWCVSEAVMERREFVVVVDKFEARLKSHRRIRKRMDNPCIMTSCPQAAPRTESPVGCQPPASGKI
jgi:hypothetical protein